MPSSLSLELHLMVEPGEAFSLGTKTADLVRKAAYHRAYMKKYPQKRDEYQNRYYAKKLARSKQKVVQKDFLFLDNKTETPPQDVELPQPCL